MLAERRVLLDSAETVAACAEEMSEFLATSESAETRAFVRSFVKAIPVRPGRATIHYTIPPPDSPIGGADAGQLASTASRLWLKTATSRETDLGGASALRAYSAMADASGAGRVAPA